jgi:PAS domain S-box-containing protein
MTEKKEQPIDSAKLRRRAEDRLGEKTAPPHRTEIEPLRLHHELQVHQIELEMQNDELRQQSEELQRLFIEHAPAALAMFDRDMRYISVSRRWRNDFHLGDREIIGKSHYEIFSEISREWKEAHRRGLAGEVLRAEADRFERLDGSEQFVSWEVRPWYDAAGVVGGIVIFAEDITESILAERALKETQDALSRLTQEKNIILNNAPTGISITIDRKQVLISRKIEELFQYSKEDMEFQTTRKLFPSDAAYDKFWQESYPVLAQGLVYEAEQELVRKDGRHIFVRYIGKAIEPSDMSKGTIWLLDDITERKLSEVALRESEKEFRLLAEAMPQIVWITRPDGWNIYFNQQWQDYTGQTLEESYGDGWFKPFHPEDKQRAWDAWQNATTHGAVYSLECRLRRADGVYLWWLIRGVPVLDEHGSMSKWFGTCTDINELKQAENDLVLAKTAAESANRAKSEFLANMSHEIRTPMNGVLGMAQLLEMTDPTKEQQKYIKTLKQSGNDLIVLINDILDLSKVEAGKITIELTRFNLHQCIKDIVMMQKLAANDKGLSLEVDLAEDIPHLLMGDPQRVRQILLNLLGNAVKFTARGGITISTQLLEQNDATVLIQITVCDTGIGISTEMLDKIFRPFEQGDGSINRKYGGTGLGLSISLRMAELLGGHLSANSTKNVGSCFKVTLPFSIVRDTPTTPDPTPKPSINRDGPPLRILYADDDQTNVTVNASMLRKFGHGIITVENGGECLKALEQGASDIVLMDIQMPVMNGVEALREIRKKEQGTSRHQPVIALTAYALQGDEEHFLEEGFDGYVSKPIDINKLLREMQRVVGGQQGCNQVQSSAEVTLTTTGKDYRF